eukprot:jgi/Chrzof1/5494/Cz16g05110.t1
MCIGSQTCTVEIRPLLSQTCTARIQKFPDGSGSPQMFLDVSKCVQKFLEVSRSRVPPGSPHLSTDRNTELRILSRQNDLGNRIPSGYGPTPTRTIAVLLRKRERLLHIQPTQQPAFSVIYPDCRTQPRGGVLTTRVYARR